MGILYENGSSAFGSARYIKADKYAPQYSLYDPLPLFRKEFMLDEFKNARIAVQSPGFARYYINGRDITDDVFISAVSDYRKILWYDEYDVTHLLQKGKNTICVIAGNGFFNESFSSAWGMAPWRDAPQFALRLCLDGKEAVVSDKTWKCSRDRSHIIYSHLRSGEYWDMRKKDDAWMYVGYDDLDWRYSVEKEDPITAEFRLTPCQPVKEVERIKPVDIVKTERGYLVDFGVAVSGYLEVGFTEKRDSEIIFRYAEDIDANGYPKHNGMDGPGFYPNSPFQVNKMIASGVYDVFKPLFSYHGFRYVLIEGLSHEPKAEELSACFIHNDVKRRSSFESGNEVLDFIYNAGIRSTYCNMFWCLTDCPTREKLGWLNDAQASLEQVVINFDSLSLLEKWYADILISMFDDGSLDGAIPAATWEWGHACGPVCGCFLYELPYRVYLYTGRTEMLLEGMDCFERYLAFLEKKVSEKHEFILGDWEGHPGGAVPKQMISELYLLKGYDVTALAHRIAGTDIDRWEQRRAEWRRTLAERYIDDAGRCVVEEQTAVAMLLQMNVIKDEAVLAEQLVSIVERDRYQFRGGMVGIQYTYYALSKIGRGDIAYRLLTETVPGYRSWFESGATTLWEIWDGADNGSHNHHMYSGVIAWMFRCLLGITPLERRPGFEEIELHPTFISSLGYARASMDTVRGRIEAEWHYSDGGYTYIVTLPAEIRATFRGELLKKGKNEFFISQE